MAPERSVRRPDSSPPAALSAAPGTMTRPISSDDSPWEKANSTGSPINGARLAAITEKLMPANARYFALRSNSRWMNGELANAWRATRVPTPTAAITAPTITQSDVQPDRDPSVGTSRIPATISPRPMPPIRSRLPADRCSNLGSALIVNGIVSATDAVTKNMDRHPISSESTPPNNGPAADPTPMVAAMTPNAMPLDSGP